MWVRNSPSSSVVSPFVASIAFRSSCLMHRHTALENLGLRVEHGDPEAEQFRVLLL